jgi:hypothetical protein
MEIVQDSFVKKVEVSERIFVPTHDFCDVDIIIRTSREVLQIVNFYLPKTKSKSCAVSLSY